MRDFNSRLSRSFILSKQRYPLQVRCFWLRHFIPGVLGGLHSFFDRQDITALCRCAYTRPMIRTKPMKDDCGPLQLINEIQEARIKAWPLLASAKPAPGTT